MSIDSITDIDSKVERPSCKGARLDPAAEPIIVGFAQRLQCMIGIGPDDSSRNCRVTCPTGLCQSRTFPVPRIWLGDPVEKAVNIDSAGNPELLSFYIRMSRAWNEK